jgi:hypothetical protein
MPCTISSLEIYSPCRLYDRHIPSDFPGYNTTAGHIIAAATSKMRDPAKMSTVANWAKSNIAVIAECSQYAGISCVWNPKE